MTGKGNAQHGPLEWSRLAAVPPLESVTAADDPVRLGLSLAAGISPCSSSAAALPPPLSSVKNCNPKELARAEGFPPIIVAPPRLPYGG